MQAGQLERVAPVRLDPVPALGGNQRRGDHRAVDLQLRAPPRQHEAGRPRLVADAQFHARMRLLEFRKHLLQGVQVVGDRPVKAGFAAPAFREGDGDVFRMDVESGEQ